MKRRDLLLIPIAVGCNNPSTECRTHCWEHVQTIQDTSPNDGRFDGLCDYTTGQDDRSPPLPPGEASSGMVCVETQAEHNDVEAVIRAIQEDCIGSCAGACAAFCVSGSQIQVYEDLVSPATGVGLSLEARNHCLNWLTTGDLEPFITGNQVCEYSQAVSLCNTYVKTPAENDLLEMDDGGIAQPEYAGPLGTKTADPCDFIPELAETGDGGSVDDTGAGADPFGDLDTLISCSPQTTCSVDSELLWNVQQFFSVFYDEGVLLDIVSAGPYPCGGYAGVKVSGLNSGEDSKALADEFGIMNNDLITVIEGITLSSEANVEAALTDLSTTTDPVTLTIRRRSGTSCAASNYTITVTY